MSESNQLTPISFQSESSNENIPFLEMTDNLFSQSLPPHSLYGRKVTSEELLYSPVPS